MKERNKESKIIFRKQSFKKRMNNRIEEKKEAKKEKRGKVD